MKISRKPHRTSGAPYQDLETCTLQYPKKLNIWSSWDSMFYISCVLVTGPLILRGTGPKVGMVLQNIQNGFPVT